MHRGHLPARILSQPKISRESDATPDTSALANTHLFFADDVDDLGLECSLQGIKAVGDKRLGFGRSRGAGGGGGCGRGRGDRVGGAYGVGHWAGSWGEVFVDSEIAQLFVDEHAEVLGDDHVHVAMADDHAVAVWDASALDGVALLGWDRGAGEGTEVEEDHDLRGGGEFVEELDEDQGSHVPDFVKEDAEALDIGEGVSAEDGGEAELAIVILCHQVRGLKAVFGFGFPLLFFAEAPEDEDAGQDDGEK